MKTMGKRILALALTLCLVLALGTTAHAAEATNITASTTGQSKAGVAITQITLTANDGAEFTDQLTSPNDYFTISGAGVTGASVTEATRGDTNNIVNLTVTNCTPTQEGSLVVTVQKTAFADGSQPTSESLVSTGISITAADDPQVSVSGAALTAGQQGQITLTSSTNHFKSSPQTSWFTLTGGVEGAPSKVSGEGETVTLDVTPTQAQAITIEISKEAFTYQPGSEKVTAQSTVSVSSPSGSVSKSGDTTFDLTAGSNASGQVTLTATDTLKFISGSISDGITLGGTGAEGLSLTANGDGDKTATLSLQGTPTKAGDLTVTVTTAAFQFSPSSVTGGESISIGSVKAIAEAPTLTVQKSDLAAGKAGGEIQLKIKSGGNLFADPLPEDSVTFEGSDGLKATYKDGKGTDTVTLTVTGTPSQQGTVQVNVKASAFKYEYQSKADVSAQADIKYADVTATASGTLTAGVEGKIQVKLTGSVFNDGISKDSFTLGDAGTGLDVTKVEGGTTDTATLTVTPSKAGQITVKVKKDALKYKPDAETDIDAGSVTVSAPTGGVNAVLEGGTLTAGTAAGDTKIKLTTTGTLNFKDSQASENFTLENGTTGKIGTLTVSNAEYSGLDKSVTLTLTGIPEAGGDFTVKVKQDAFVAKTQDPTDITATGSLTIGYPTIKLTADRDHIAEGDTVTTITLTATGSPFNEISAKDGFTLNGEGATGVELQSVQAAAGTYTVTLTLSGTTSREGDFTITVPKTAFQYQPETDPKVTITVGEPEGTITGTQNGKLYVGTPADGVTITVTITDSKGLHFDPSASTDAFTLGGTGSPELTVKSVAISGDTATLTLSGTPTTAGDFTITAETSAFKPTPKQTKAVTGEFTVGDPNVALTVSDNTLQAGAENGTVTLTLTGSKFVSALTDMVTLVPGEDYKNDNLTIDVKRVDDTTVTVTVNGVPSVMGKISFEFKTDAFTPAPTAAVTVAVDVAKGEQAAEAEANPGAPGIGFTAPLDQLAAAVLTPEEQALYEKGAEVKIELVESVGAQIPQTDKTAVEAAVGDYTVGEYLDVSLVKSVNGVTDDITETKTPIQVVFTIPTDLRAANRSFAVIRVHDGTATLLEPVASTAETITVESSLFSTYAIVYREVVPTPTPTPAATETPAPTEAPATPTEAPVEPTETPEPTEAPDTTEAPEGTEAPKAPETGDGFMPGLWMGLLAVCAAGLVLTLIQLRRRSRG